MRPLVFTTSCIALLCSCGKSDTPPVKTVAEPEAKAGLVYDTPVAPSLPKTALAEPCEDAAPSNERHLGDGVTSYNFYFLADELKSRPGSEKETREIARQQQEAMASSGDTILKPPSANLVESEFSHLLGAVVDSNEGIGAAVFNLHGLKIGAAGLQVEGMVLPKSRLEAVAKMTASGATQEQPYTCSGLEELAKNCDPKSIQGISCWDLEFATKNCHSPIVAHYRPVFDGEDKAIGVSMLVTRTKSPCPASAGERGIDTR